MLLREPEEALRADPAHHAQAVDGQDEGHRGREEGRVVGAKGGVEDGAELQLVVRGDALQPVVRGPDPLGQARDVAQGVVQPGPEQQDVPLQPLEEVLGGSLVQAVGLGVGGEEGVEGAEDLVLVFGMAARRLAAVDSFEV